MLTTLQVDWNLVAEQAGYKTARSAQVTFRHFMRKFEGRNCIVSRPLSMPQPQTDMLRTSFASSSTPSKVKKMAPKNRGRKGTLSFENGEKGYGKGRIFRTEVGSEKESNMIYQLVKQERGSEFGMMNDSDSYAEEQRDANVLV